MKYDRYAYLWPPRPERAQGAALLHSYQQQGWWAQAKMDGTCLVLAVHGRCTHQLVARTRHGDKPPARWYPGEACQAFARRLPGQGWYVFVAELLHTRGVGVKDTIYLHDVLVDDGNYLVGETMGARARRLSSIFGLPFIIDRGLTPTPWSHVIVSDGIWLVRNHDRRFRELWDNPPGAYVEGLVLKDPAAHLRLCASPTANSAGLAKCRYSTDQLNF